MLQIMELIPLQCEYDRMAGHIHQNEKNKTELRLNIPYSKQRKRSS